MESLTDAKVEKLVNATSVNSFKNKIDKFLGNQDVYYDDFKADVNIATTYHRN